jgi:tetratricopeptide (TPR) repeat protein
MKGRSLVLALALCSPLVLASDNAPISAQDSVRYATLRKEVSGTIVAPSKVVENLEQAVRIYPNDGDVWWRLGQARLQIKKYDDAIDAYKNALRLGAFGNKFKAGALYDISCAYSLKGDKERAFDYLRQSMAAGFRDLQHVRTDKDLESLHADKRWEEMAATKDVAKMGRDEAWRYDLWLLHREVTRVHFNPYSKFTKAEQDAWVSKLNREIPKLTDAQIMVAFMKYMRRINDGHTHIRPGQASGPHMWAQIGLPVQLFWYQEGVFINAADPSQKELVGAQVLRVAGKPVEDVIHALDEVTPQDNSQGLKAFAGRFLATPPLLNGLGLSPSGKEVTYTLRLANGQTKDVTLPAVAGGVTPTWVLAREADPAKAPLYLKNRDKSYWFEPLPDMKAVYMQYNSVRNDPAENTEAFAARLFDYINTHDVERLIVDVRWNGGGNSFLNRPIVNGIIGCTKVHKPGGLFVITGRGTFSAAQNFTTDLDRALDPIFVGEPTGSSPNFVGESVRFSLPYSKMEGSISDLYWQRSWPMDHRTWIAPDLPAEPSFELYKANRDPAMEAIEAFLKAGGSGV